MRGAPGRFGAGRVLAALLIAALAAGCGGQPTGLVSGWARVSGTVVRAPTGAPVPGLTPSFAVFRDGGCTDPVLTTVDAMPDPVTDAAGLYQTDLVVHGWGVFRGCLAVTAGGVTARVPASFGSGRAGAPAVTVDVSIP